jgi:hypothetical protein
MGEVQLFASGTVRHDPDALALLRDELVAHPEAWQLDLFISVMSSGASL